MRIINVVLKGLALSALLSFGAAPALAQCVNCEDDDVTGKHRAPYDESIIFGYYGPPHLQWQWGWCAFEHQAGCCNSEFCLSGDSKDGTNLFAVLARADGADLQGLLEKYAGRIVYNYSRRAIQVFDCSGRVVVAHIPRGNIEVAGRFGDPPM
jgi:hypothetical protein